MDLNGNTEGQASDDIVKLASDVYLFLESVPSVVGYPQNIDGDPEKLYQCALLNITQTSNGEEKEVHTDQSFLLRWSAIEADHPHWAHRVRDLLQPFATTSMPHFEPIRDYGVLRSEGLEGNDQESGPSTGEQTALYYTIDGTRGLQGSLCDLYNHGWPRYLLEAFFWTVLEQLATGLSYLHRGFRHVDEPSDPNRSTALCAQNLLQHVRVTLAATDEDRLGSRSLYPTLTFVDYSRLMSARTFIPHSVWDSNGINLLEWYHPDFESVMTQDVFAVGQVFHVLAHQRDLDDEQHCVCQSGAVNPAYSKRLMNAIHEACQGSKSAHELAILARPIAAEMRANKPNLKMSIKVPRLFAEAKDACEKPIQPALARFRQEEQVARNARSQASVPSAMSPSRLANVELANGVLRGADDLPLKKRKVLDRSIAEPSKKKGRGV